MITHIITSRQHQHQVLNTQVTVSRHLQTLFLYFQSVGFDFEAHSAGIENFSFDCAAGLLKN